MDSYIGRIGSSRIELTDELIVGLTDGLVSIKVNGLILMDLSLVDFMDSHRRGILPQPVTWYGIWRITTIASVADVALSQKVVVYHRT